MADRIRVLLTEEEVDKRINEVAAKISEDYAGDVYKRQLLSSAGI